MTGATAAAAGDTGRAVLEGSDIAVYFGGVKAVDGVSFRITPGKIFGILGPNGSGKSTLLGAITRLVPLTRGSLVLDGARFDRVPAADVARRGVARTFQTVRLLPELTVLENVQLGGDLGGSSGPGPGSSGPGSSGPGSSGPGSGSPGPGSSGPGLGSPSAGSPAQRPEARRWDWRRWDRSWRERRGASPRVREAIERTRLTGLEQLRPGELSYGTQRRVEIARAIAMRPALLLLDEPTAGMNQSERREISRLLRQLRGEGLTQLLVEHDVQMMIDTCDYVLAMNFGRLIAQGPPDAVVRDPAVQQAYLGKKWRRDA